MNDCPFPLSFFLSLGVLLLKFIFVVVVGFQKRVEVNARVSTNISNQKLTHFNASKNEIMLDSGLILSLK